MPNLSERLQEEELLDNLKLDGQSLHRTLRDLKLINQLLLNTRAVTQAVLKIIKTQEIKPDQEIVIVDLGCGGGDLLIHLSKVLKKNHIKAKLIGIDGNPNSISYCQKAAGDVDSLHFQVHDILDSSFELLACDIMISSHFVYHLGEKGLAFFLEKQSKNISTAIIISELIRSSLAYYLFKALTPLLGMGPITRQDGLTAIKRAFTFKELDKIISKVDLHLKKHYRFLHFRQLVVFTS